MNEIHRLKILPEYFIEVKCGRKTFEIRKNDRNFQLGDIVMLEEWNSEKEKYTGNYMYVQITYITDFEQQPGYVVFAFEDITESMKRKTLRKEVLKFLRQWKN